MASLVVVSSRLLSSSPPLQLSFSLLPPLLPSVSFLPLLRLFSFLFPLACAPIVRSANRRKKKKQTFGVLLQQLYCPLIKAFVYGRIEDKFDKNRS